MRPFLKTLIFGVVVLATSCDSNDEKDTFQPFGIRSNVVVKALVGDLLYEKVSASLIVEGFTAQNESKWRKEFDYTPDTQTLEIEAGFDHYTFIARVWGVEDSQTVSGQQLFHDRSDGPSPTTYVFAPELPAPKLKSVLRSMEKDIDGALVMRPLSREEFIWDEGRLSEIHSYEYDEDTEAFSFARYNTLIYQNGRLTKKEGRHAANDMLYIETFYEYLANGNVSQMREDNHEGGYSVVADVSYNYEQKLVTVQYANSNGTGFTYNLKLEDKNPTWDQIKNGSTVCSEGTFQYDLQINPFRHLGYLDLLMRNYSVNNKTLESETFSACYFPEMWAERHEYTYNDAGLPLTKVTTYSSGKKGTEVYTY